MKTFKVIDVAGQVILTILALVLFAINDSGGAFWTFYVGLGSWQLLSYFIHLAAGLKSSFRLAYGIALTGVVVLGIVCFITIFFIYIFFYAMLGIGVLLGAYYLVITIIEMLKINNQNHENL